MITCIKANICKARYVNKVCSKWYFQKSALPQVFAHIYRSKKRDIIENLQGHKYTFLRYVNRYVDVLQSYWYTKPIIGLEDE